MIKGLIAPILSPFNDDLSFNQGLYNDLAAELLETGCSGLAPFGTTGEALSVSCAERMAALWPARDWWRNTRSCGIAAALSASSAGLASVLESST